MVRPSLTVPGSTSAAVSLSMPMTPEILVASRPSRMRALLTAGLLAASGVVTRALRKAPADAWRRRLLRRLDKVAPKMRYSHQLQQSIVNSACPVCLSEFSCSPERYIRVQIQCKHALCSDCMETWVVHTAKSHLNPSRFGLTRGGDIVSWSQPPFCPLCRSKLSVISDSDIREAVLAAMAQQGGAISNPSSHSSYVLMSEFYIFG